MSTDLFSPSSNISKKPVLLPWEMIGHIFSFCDQPTLVALSLVSFGCWELAGPILYQDVEIVDLDGLASLFFIDVDDSSPRLQQATPLLSRIKTLSIAIRSWDQQHQPFFDRPVFLEDEDEEDFDGCTLLLPHRLLAFTTSHLPLQSLLLPMDTFGLYKFFGFWSLQLFPLLNPVEVIHKTLEPSDDASSGAILNVSTSFLRQWNDLKRVVWIGMNIAMVPIPATPLYALWNPREDGGRRRTLELVFDFASRPGTGYRDLATQERPMSLAFYLDRGGVLQLPSRLVDLEVVVRVRKEEETLMREHVEGLEDWMKRLVVVEVV